MSWKLNMTMHYASPGGATALARILPYDQWPEEIRQRERGLTRALRRLDDLRDEMIAKLDLLTGDPDFEPGGDDEPSLTFTGYRGANDDDREVDDSDDEPSLAAPEAAQFFMGGRTGSNDDREEQQDAEHSLGWSERASLVGYLGVGTDELEPDADKEPDPYQGGFL